MSSIANSITAVSAVAGSSGLIAAAATTESPWLAAIVTIVVSILAAIPPSLLALAAWQKSSLADEKATKIEKATDGINSTLTKELAVERAENRGLRELLASQEKNKDQADAVSLAMATTATPSANAPAKVEVVNADPVVVEVVADSTKEPK